MTWQWVALILGALLIAAGLVAYALYLQDRDNARLTKSTLWPPSERERHG